MLSTSNTITDINSSLLSSIAEPDNSTSVQEPPNEADQIHIIRVTSMANCMYDIAVNLLKTTSTGRPDLQSVAIQCDLLAAPPLRKLGKEQNVASDSKLKSISIDPEDTDLDASFHIIQEDTTTE